MESWGSDIIGLSYRKGQPGLIGNRIFDINAAIRGPQVEPKQDKTRQIVDGVCRFLEISSDEIEPRLYNLVNVILEAE